MNEPRQPRNLPRAKKHFGQNFLTDTHVLSRIVKSSGIDKNTCVVEIGPGTGALTEYLLASAKHVLAYEIDKDLIPFLKERFAKETNFTLKQQDILKVQIDQDLATVFPDNMDIVVVSNLPYYITTPILMRFLETTHRVKRMVFMVQYEVGKRFTSKPNTKDYNALSIAIQYRANAKLLFKVPRTVFVPVPNVDSAVVELDILEHPLYPVDNETFFFEFIKNLFGQRRKTVVNNLVSTYPTFSKDQIIEALLEEGLDPQVRAEAIDLEKTISFANRIHGLLKQE